jgi:transposase
MLGVTRRTVNRWQQEAKQPPRKKSTRPPGRPPKLPEKQVKALEKALSRGAYSFGYTGDYWTLDRIAHLIWQKFGVRYDPSGVWHVLDRMNWSCQRPQRRALQRDDAAVEKWKARELPRIKKVS